MGVRPRACWAYSAHRRCGAASGRLSAARPTCLSPGEAMVVPVQTSLSLTSRWLTRVIAVTYLLLGLIMFVVPGWSAHHFPWKVSPFVAMTIGSYLLGSAWMAGIIQHTWTFARVYTLLLYLWLFGVLETVVVIIHRDKLPAGGRADGSLSDHPGPHRGGRAGWAGRLAPPTAAAAGGRGHHAGLGQGAAGHLRGGRRIHRRGRPLRAEAGAECPLLPAAADLVHAGRTRRLLPVTQLVRAVHDRAAGHGHPRDVSAGRHWPGHHHCDRDIAEHRHLPFQRPSPAYRLSRHLRRGDDRRRGDRLAGPPRNESCGQASRLT